MKIFTLISFTLFVICAGTSAVLYSFVDRDKIKTIVRDNILEHVEQQKPVHQKISVVAGRAVQKFDSLEIRSDSTAIYVQEALDENITLKYYQAGTELIPVQVIQKNNQQILGLSVIDYFDKFKRSERMSFNLKWNNSEDFQLTFVDKNEITVYVPKSIQTLKIINTSGDVKITDLRPNKLNIETVSGDVKLMNVTVNENLIETVSGDIRLKAEVKKSVLKSVSGDVKFISLLADNDITAETTSGDIRVSVSQQPDVKFSYKLTSGSLNAGWETNWKRKNPNHTEMTLGSGKGSWNFSSVSGDIKLDEAEQN